MSTRFCTAHTARSFSMENNGIPIFKITRGRDWRNLRAGNVSSGARYQQSQGARSRWPRAQHGFKFCANNYLGLVRPGGDPGAKHAIEPVGLWFSTSGAFHFAATQTLHKELERKLSEVRGPTDTNPVWSVSSQWRLIRTIARPEDAIIRRVNPCQHY